jgi:hypothetical protein
MLVIPAKNRIAMPIKRTREKSLARERSLTAHNEQKRLMGCIFRASQISRKQTYRTKKRYWRMRQSTVVQQAQTAGTLSLLQLYQKVNIAANPFLPWYHY